MAGELLIRLLDWESFQSLDVDDPVSEDDADACFLDRGEWSLSEHVGADYVLIEGSAFYEEANWLYEDHHLLSELPLLGSETATLLVPRDTVVLWQTEINNLPPKGKVAREEPEILATLSGMLGRVVENPRLCLTIQSLL